MLDGHCRHDVRSQLADVSLIHSTRIHPEGHGTASPRARSVQSEASVFDGIERTRELGDEGGPDEDKSDELLNQRLTKLHRRRQRPPVPVGFVARRQPLARPGAHPGAGGDRDQRRYQPAAGRAAAGPRRSSASSSRALLIPGTRQAGSTAPPARRTGTSTARRVARPPSVMRNTSAAAKKARPVAAAWTSTPRPFWSTTTSRISAPTAFAHSRFNALDHLVLDADVRLRTSSSVSTGTASRRTGERATAASSFEPRTIDTLLCVEDAATCCLRPSYDRDRQVRPRGKQRDQLRGGLGATLDGCGCFIDAGG